MSAPPVAPATVGQVHLPAGTLARTIKPTTLARTNQELIPRAPQGVPRTRRSVRREGLRPERLIGQDENPRIICHRIEKFVRTKTKISAYAWLLRIQIPVQNISV